MAVMSDNGGAILQYVTRALKGNIPSHQVKFDKTSQKNVRVQDGDNQLPQVIVFFPNRTVQVMDVRMAESKGFLRQPEILGFDRVDNPRSPAGQYKFAMRTETRNQAWIAMENALIGHCISKNGIPLPEGVTYDQQSLWAENTEREVA